MRIASEDMYILSAGRWILIQFNYIINQNVYYIFRGFFFYTFFMGWILIQFN